MGQIHETAANLGPESLRQYVVSDFVPVTALPELPSHQSHGDTERIIAQLGHGGRRAARYRVSPSDIERISPPEVTTWNDIGFNVEGLNQEAEILAGDRFRQIIRMGGAFEELEEGLTREEVVALAVGSMGVDTTLSPLGGHGGLQARRVFEVMTANQLMHQIVFNGVRNQYGNTRAALIAYDNFRRWVPNFTDVDVAYGVLCGAKHDDGEAVLGRDVPFEAKQDPNYVIIESAAAVGLAHDMHYPAYGSKSRRLVDQRAQMESVKGSDEAMKFSREHLERIGHFLHPQEIQRAIFGTERQAHDRLPRGAAFGLTVERMEYVLSGIRAFEAVEHNFNGVAGGYTTRSELLRLGVSTQYNSLAKLINRSRKYLSVYDFLRQNEARIDNYLSEVNEDMGTGNESSVFGIDPFIAYPDQPDRMGKSRPQAEAEFKKTFKLWRRWQDRQRRPDKQNIVADVWEAYFGTVTPLTSGEDISFLQLTARRVLQGSLAADDNGLVRVEKSVRDLWGHSAIAGSTPVPVRSAA